MIFKEKYGLIEIKLDRDELTLDGWLAGFGGTRCTEP